MPSERKTNLRGGCSFGNIVPKANSLGGRLSSSISIFSSFFSPFFTANYICRSYRTRSLDRISTSKRTSGSCLKLARLSGTTGISFILRAMARTVDESKPIWNRSWRTFSSIVVWSSSSPMDLNHSRKFRII